MVQALDARGRPVRLGLEIGRGGEGTVHEIQGRPDHVAKLYHRPPDSRHAAKLTAMVGLAEERLLRVAAWPTDTLHAATGTIIGFTMPRVSGHQPVFQLYSPKLRLNAFPKVDWRFLIHAAANAARAFAVVHNARHVIGDVNHGNLVVAEDATVRLIDCDSFQVTRDGQTWFCRVGVGTHQPPEMQALASYDGILRTPNHDCFGLAVLIFQLLCMARHPFAGRFVGHGAPPSIEEAIAQGRYAFSRDQSRTMMAPPPGSLPLSALTPRIRDLFETAFSLSSRGGGRPDPAAWISALDELAGELKPCTLNKGHVHHRGLSQCPWCAIETATGVPLFPGLFVGAGPSGTGMLTLWPQVLAVSAPKPLPPAPSAPAGHGRPSPEAEEAAEHGRSLRIGAYVSLGVAVAAMLALAPASSSWALAGVVGLLAVLVGGVQDTGPGAAYRETLSRLEQEWQALVRAWEPSSACGEFATLRRRLDDLKKQHDGLGAERGRRLQKLAEGARERQLQAYLDRFAIADARISGIGRAKVATLSANGIDTAGDVDAARISAIPGFGEVTVKKLVGWRKHHERGFVFDPSSGPDPASVAKVEREIAQERTRIEALVSASLPQLRQLASMAEEHRQTLERRCADLAPRLSQVRADANAVPTDQSANRARIILGIFASLGVVLSALPSSKQQLSPQQRSPPPATAALFPQPPAPAPQAKPLESPPPIGPLPAAPAFDPLLSAHRQAREIVITPPASASGPPLGPVPPLRQQHLSRDRVVTRQTSNVREGPSGAASVVRIAPQGTTLSVFDRRSGWVQIGEETPWGWIHSSLLEPRNP